MVGRSSTSPGVPCNCGSRSRTSSTRGSTYRWRSRGGGADHVLAFARVCGDDVGVVVAPRLVTPLADGTNALRLRPDALSGTRIELPDGLSETGLVDVLTGTPVSTEVREVTVVFSADNLLRGFPVALLATS